MPLDKPESVAQDPFKSAKWDELAAGRGLSPADAPALTLLVQWYAVVQRCIDDMDAAGGQVAYRNDMGDLRALPQIATMRQASAEIRQLTRQLGLDGPAEGETHATLKKNRGQPPPVQVSGETSAHLEMRLFPPNTGRAYLTSYSFYPRKSAARAAL